jgi:hypothetical protein
MSPMNDTQMNLSKSFKVIGKGKNQTLNNMNIKVEAGYDSNCW